MGRSNLEKNESINFMHDIPTLVSVLGCMYSAEVRTTEYVG